MKSPLILMGYEEVFMGMVIKQEPFLKLFLICLN